MSAETNKNLVNYFDSLIIQNSFSSSNATTIDHDDDVVNDNNDDDRNHSDALRIEKTSVNLIKKIWDENKDKEIKLMENINLSNYINDIKCNNKFSMEKPSHFLLVNDCDEMLSRVIAINSDFIVEFPQSPTNLYFNANKHPLQFSDNDISSSNNSITTNLKFCDIIKICLSDDLSLQTKKSSASKKSRKNRSMSESYCDVIKDVAEQLNLTQLNFHDFDSDNSCSDNNQIINRAPPKFRKSRSYSESNHNDDDRNCKIKKYKGILKHTVYNDSIIAETSEEDIGISDDWTYKLERSDSESCKKSVRFDDVIKKKLFRFVYLFYFFLIVNIFIFF